MAGFTDITRQWVISWFTAGDAAIMATDAYANDL